MAKFNEYTQKATPEDADTLMIYDAAAKANKLSPFSGIWNWIVGKLTNAVISNLQTRNRTVVGALNEINDGLPAGGIYDLDKPPKKMIFSAIAGSTNLPNGFGGANAVTVIQMNLGNSKFDSMIAFTFAVDKIAIRRKNGTKNWSEWKYFNTAEILSNLTTTNKSSLVGAINELNSKALRYKNANVTDWNNVIEIGIYSGNNAANSPTSNIWINAICLSSNSNTNFLHLIAFTINGHIYSRYMIDGKWEAWILIK